MSSFDIADFPPAPSKASAAKQASILAGNAAAFVTPLSQVFNNTPNGTHVPFNTFNGLSASINYLASTTPSTNNNNTNQAQIQGKVQSQYGNTANGSYAPQTTPQVSPLQSNVGNNTQSTAPINQLTEAQQLLQIDANKRTLITNLTTLAGDQKTQLDHMTDWIQNISQENYNLNNTLAEAKVNYTAQIAARDDQIRILTDQLNRLSMNGQQIVGISQAALNLQNAYDLQVEKSNGESLRFATTINSVAQKYFSETKQNNAFVKMNAMFNAIQKLTNEQVNKIVNTADINTNGVRQLEQLAVELDNQVQIAKAQKTVAGNKVVNWLSAYATSVRNSVNANLSAATNTLSAASTALKGMLPSVQPLPINASASTSQSVNTPNMGQVSTQQSYNKQKLIAPSLLGKSATPGLGTPQPKTNINTTGKSPTPVVTNNNQIQKQPSVTPHIIQQPAIPITTPPTLIKSSSLGAASTSPPVTHQVLQNPVVAGQSVNTSTPVIAGQSVNTPTPLIPSTSVAAADAALQALINAPINTSASTTSPVPALIDPAAVTSVYPSLLSGGTSPQPILAPAANNSAGPSVAFTIPPPQQKPPVQGNPQIARHLLKSITAHDVIDEDTKLQGSDMWDDHKNTKRNSYVKLSDAELKAESEVLAKIVVYATSKQKLYGNHREKILQRTTLALEQIQEDRKVNQIPITDSMFIMSQNANTAIKNWMKSWSMPELCDENITFSIFKTALEKDLGETNNYKASNPDTDANLIELLWSIVNQLVPDDMTFVTPEGIFSIIPADLTGWTVLQVLLMSSKWVIIFKHMLYRTLVAQGILEPSDASIQDLEPYRFGTSNVEGLTIIDLRAALSRLNGSACYYAGGTYCKSAIPAQSTQDHVHQCDQYLEQITEDGLDMLYNENKVEFQKVAVSIRTMLGLYNNILAHGQNGVYMNQLCV